MARRAAKKGGGWLIRLVLIAVVAFGAWWYLSRDADHDETAPDSGEVVVPQIDREALRREIRREVRDELAKSDEARPAKPAPSRPDPSRALAPHERNGALAPSADREPVRRAAPEPEKKTPEADEAAAEKVAEPEPQPEPEPEPEERAEAPEPEPTASDTTLTVLDLTTAANVDRSAREPTGVSTAFEAGDDKAVWAYAVVRNDSDTDRKVTFIWKQDGVERNRANLRIGAKAARWRTWSKKNLLDGTAGHWTVEVVDEAGLPLASRTFEVR